LTTSTQLFFYSFSELLPRQLEYQQPAPVTKIFDWKRKYSSMVMDDIFGMTDLHEAENIFGFDTELSSVVSEGAAASVKNMDLDMPPINLEELEFDFEDMKDFGPWIETDVGANIEPEPCKPESLGERLNFKDLEIKEAVRYDCMWSSYNEFHADTKVSSKTDSTSSISSSPTLNLSNSFYDSLLNNFDTPSCTSDNSDTNSDKSSDMDTDEDTDNSSDAKQQIYTNIKDIESRNESSYQSSVRLFASMDHCYNISSTQLDNEKFINNQSGPLTPPMSSDDEDSSQQQTNIKFSRTSQKVNNNKFTYIRTKASNINKSQSLLKKSYTKQSSEAKFSFKLNLKDAKNSRSLLKQRIQKVKIIKAPKLKEEGAKAKSVQSAIRKRKERSLKMQEGEAREIHNQMERQRRNELKLSFDKLKTVLPELASSDKASKQQILDNAVDTVKMIKSTEATLQSRVNSLSKNNNALKEKLRQLKEDILNSDSFTGIDRW